MPKFKPYPDESPVEALERISENIENEGLPASDASLRSESYQLGGAVRPPTASSITPPPQYNKGGKVKKTTYQETYEAGKKSGRTKSESRHVALATSRAVRGDARSDILEVVKASKRTQPKNKKKK